MKIAQQIGINHKLKTQIGAVTVWVGGWVVVVVEVGGGATKLRRYTSMGQGDSVWIIPEANTCHGRCRQVVAKFLAGVGRCQTCGWW